MVTVHPIHVSHIHIRVHAMMIRRYLWWNVCNVRTAVRRSSLRHSIIQRRDIKDFGTTAVAFVFVVMFMFVWNGK